MDRPNQLGIAESKTKLLGIIKGAGLVTFVRGYGNIGDDLIYAGTRQLLADVDYTEVSVLDLGRARGGLGLLSGSGAWCRAYPDMTKYLPLVEKRFDRVIILPSSFDVSVESVRQSLAGSNALVFAREMESYRQIKDICNADIAHDCAFYFDYAPYQRSGRGILTAYRKDRESHDGRFPARNNDISISCETLDEWLWTIARHEIIRTDRAHVMIAGALLGKQVECRSSSYHKIPAIVEFSLKGYPVRLGQTTEQLDSDLESPAADRSQTMSTESSAATRPEDVAIISREALARTAQEIASLLAPGERFVLVDDGQISKWPIISRRAIPFLEIDGQFGGRPIDDGAAISELIRVRDAGASFIAFAWPAFWWLKHYQDFQRYLRTHFSSVLSNERLLVFDLKPESRPHGEQIPETKEAL